MTSRSDNDDAAQRMLGAVPGASALGRGPATNGGFSRHDYHHPAAGWGAARSVAEVIEKARVELARGDQPGPDTDDVRLDRVAAESATGRRKR